MNTYTFHEDPGHGWLEVPVSRLVELGIADKITPYSYRRGNTAYLEEDCDLSTFCRAMEAQGIEFTTSTLLHKYDAPCRNMPHYRKTS